MTCCTSWQVVQHDMLHCLVGGPSHSDRVYSSCVIPPCPSHLPVCDSTLSLHLHVCDSTLSFTCMCVTTPCPSHLPVCDSTLSFTPACV